MILKRNVFPMWTKELWLKHIVSKYITVILKNLCHYCKQMLYWCLFNFYSFQIAKPLSNMPFKTTMNNCLLVLFRYQPTLSHLVSMKAEIMILLILLPKPMFIGVWFLLAKKIASSTFTVISASEKFGGVR